MAKKEINKSEEIRKYAAEHPDATDKQVVEALGMKGIETTPSAVYQALGKGKNKNGDGGGKIKIKKKGKSNPIKLAADLIRACRGPQQAKDMIDMVQDAGL